MNKDDRFAINKKTDLAHVKFRVKNGGRTAVRQPWKLLILIPIYALVYYAVNSGVNSLPMIRGVLWAPVLLLCILGTLIGFYIIGCPWQSSRIADEFRRIGLVNDADEPPFLISVSRDRKNKRVREYLFDGSGIPLSEFEKMLDEIEAVLDLSVISFCRERGKRRILMRAVPAKGDLPNMVNWNDSMLSPESFVLTLGEGYTGPVTLDLRSAPHVLLGGTTGSGKTVLLKLMLYQCVKKGAKVYIADFKGLDYSRFFEENCVMCLDWDSTRAALETLMKEKERRLRLFRSVGAVNIDEYNAKTGEDLPRLIFACDEYAQMTAPGSRSKEEKELLYAIENLTASVARLGRAFGIHLILATQRPDADVLSGQIKNNMDHRICGKADATLSTIVLGDGSANDLIPKYRSGRFLLGDGTLFQAYWFNEASVGGWSGMG